MVGLVAVATHTVFTVLSTLAPLTAVGRTAVLARGWFDELSEEAREQAHAEIGAGRVRQRVAETGIGTYGAL